ncbi:MAG: dihydropteroate synthase [Candidatus Omnitrophica bacterium]|nr:dihydropteroate synthase [Candidatus Omnitrophota bacterium]
MAHNKKIIEQVKKSALSYSGEPKIFACGKYKLDLSRRPLIMGILNVTPDSFSDGGIYFEKGKAIDHAFEMEKDGADIIDIGAESTRPGSMPIGALEQLKRLEGIVKILGKKLKIPISIDTSELMVAKRCLDLGASIINDVCALRKDKQLGAVIAGYNAGVILMHMKKNPRTMQQKPQYKDVINELIRFLQAAKKRAVKYGIKRENIILDPGIGFGKTTEHNLKIINFLEKFKVLGCALLVGTSRKSFIANILGLPAGEREFATAASIVCAMINGANILRVHNVRQMREVVLMTQAIREQKYR